MIDIIGALVVLGLLVTIHEGGHFLAARMFGVGVEKFSIGFGPKLFSFKRKQTDYRLSLIPLGGYVKMMGENPDEIVDDIQHSFKAKKWWQRAIIAFAGPFFNAIFALLVLIFSFSLGRSFEDQQTTIGRINNPNFSMLQVEDKIIEVNGKKVQGWSDVVLTLKKGEENRLKVMRDGQLIEIALESIDPQEFATNVLAKAAPIIGELANGMPAYNAGLMEGDEILSINGEKVKDWYDIRSLVQSSETDEITITIKRDEKVFTKNITRKEYIMDNSKILGITQHLPVKIDETYSFSEAVQAGFISTVNIIYFNYYGLYKLLMHPSSIKDNIGGPVMLVSLSKQSIEKGRDSVFTLIAVISIVLMMMNLLPIPILDGGHIFFCLLEGIFRKPLSIQTQMVLQRIGLAVLLFMMVFAFFNDFNRIFERKESISNQKSLPNKIEGELFFHTP